MSPIVTAEVACAAAAGLLIGALWLWTRWDYQHDPHRNLPRRWYQYSPETFLPPHRWDLRVLNREYRADDGTARRE